MKKVIFTSLALAGGVLLALKIQENLQRQALWQQVTDEVDF
ncbi:DLW-39 family protein [Trueperella bialowiezensis]|uniref:Uncharacterized protein n=1 Tax=Trueperella bialowiezensis TaxID=312285 RepID=A0A448PEM7_9ACTO|nr:DLW-39 family protein [Trueperella bialowiezensis]VEI13354.1 Uncharacterised protein [Trueperella bialowiezensis]